MIACSLSSSRADESNFLQILRRHGQRDRIADCLVEAGVRTALEYRWLTLVGTLVIVVAELVINRAQLIVGLFDAHLDAQVVTAIQAPGAGVTNNLAILRFGKLRALPERIRQSIHAERDIKAFGGANHFLRRIIFGLQRAIDIEIRDAGVRFHDVVDEAPLLRPHVAQKMCRDRTILRYLVFAVMFAELRAHGAMQLVVQWLNLVPEALGLALKFSRAHVEASAPHFTKVAVAKFTRAFVNKLNVALILVAHRWCNCAPARPVLFELIVVPSALHETFKLGSGNAVVITSAVLTRAVHALKLGCDQRQLFAFCRVVRCWQRRSEFQEVYRAPLFLELSSCPS